MSYAIVNDYYFKPDGDVEEGKAAARDLVRYFDEEVPAVQLSLWLESAENRLHHYHVTVFDDEQAAHRLRASDAIRKFTDRLYPHIDHSTFVSPGCDTWLASGTGVGHGGKSDEAAEDR